MEEPEIKARDSAVSRLHERFPTIPPQVIEREVDDLYVQFDDCAVRSYVPLLVEREARRKLGNTDPL